MDTNELIAQKIGRCIETINTYQILLEKMQELPVLQSHYVQVLEQYQFLMNSKNEIMLQTLANLAQAKGALC